jgi:AcrR family transcriptional regulator
VDVELAALRAGARRGLRLVDRRRDAVDVEHARENETAEARTDDRDGCRHRIPLGYADIYIPIILSTVYAIMTKKPGSTEASSQLWARPARSSRGPQPAHSRERIAEAAVKIADADGIGAASMRRVAAEIGSRATSLYRYVRNKDELLDLMVDLVMGETRIPEPSGSEPSGDWRADLTAIAHHMRAIVRRHPWMIAISAFRPTLGPNSLASMEATLKALDGRGLDIDGMLVIANALSTFVRGCAAGEIAEQQAEARSGLGREPWMQSQAQYVEMIRGSGRFPLFMRVVDEARTPHDPHLVQQGFEQGLQCLLDGVAARLP